MHSCEAASSAAPATAAASTAIPPAPLTGPQLLTQLGRLMVRAGSPSRSQRDRLLQAKLRQASGSRLGDYDSLVSSQPKPREPKEEELDLERQLERHVLALWSEQIPLCIEVVLAPDCVACFKALSGFEPEAAFHKGVEPRGLLIERWTIAVAFKKSHETHMFSTSQWLLNAVRSQLHFSQVSAWLARLSTPPHAEAQRELTAERRRKLSHEKCNIKKLESNCDQENITTENPTTKTLNLVYSIKIPGETYKTSDFNRTPTIHTFPLTEIDHKRYLKVSLESLPRTDTIPTAKCFCNQLNLQKRRLSKDMMATQDDITSKLNDLKINPPIALYNYHPPYSNVVENYDDKVKNVLDDRMHTPCSENGKHKCNCDDESDNQKSSNKKAEKKLDEKRLKDIAKHKRRVRKEIRFRDSSSDTGTSEGDSIKNKETHTSIPILQASRFDRYKAIGCYRNQTYLTLPATRIETKSPFINDSIDLTSIDKRTNTIATQTDDFICFCGSKMYLKCDGCDTKMVRSNAQYDLASMVEKDDINKTFDAKNVNKEAIKHTCDIISNKTSLNDKFINNNDNLKCDNFVSFNVSTVRKRSDDDEVSNIIKRPKLKKLFPVVDRIEKIVSDRFVAKDKPNYELLDRESDDFQYPKRDFEMRQISFSQDNADLFASLTEKESEFNFYESKPDSNKNGCKDMVKQPNSDNKAKPILKVAGAYEIKETNLNQHKVPYFSSDQGLNQIESKTYVPGVNDMKDLNLKDTDTVFDRPSKTEKRSKHPSVTEEYVFYEKNYYGTIDRNDNIESPKEENQPGFQFPDLSHEKADITGEESVKSVADLTDSPVPTASDVDKFRWRLDSAASMVFHSKTGLPLTSSPAPLKRGNNCFDFDDSINGVSGIKSALFNPEQSSESAPVSPRITSPRPSRASMPQNKLRIRPPSGLLGTFEECALKGRLNAASTVAGFTARLGAYGSFCPAQKRLPVTVFFYALGGNNAPYMGHINLGSGGYHVPRSGTIQVSLLNPHGTLVKMFVVVYALESMPPGANTFLRQRTLYLPAGAPQPSHRDLHKYLRYTIHLRFMTSKSGKLYLHTDIRIIVSRKSDIDAATAHSAILSNNQPTNHSAGGTNDNKADDQNKMAERGSNKPCRVFGGASEGDLHLGYENQNEIGYELRSFTYGPDNPKFSPR